MNKKLLLILLFLSSLFGDLIIHEKVESASYGIPISIKAFLDVSVTDVYRFSLLYRPFGNIEYIETSMIQIGRSLYMAEIPGEFIMRDFLEYYLLLEMPAHTKTVFPSNDAVNNPIRIYIDRYEEEKTFDDELDPDSENIKEFDIVGLVPDVVIISPKPGEQIISRDIFIALSYFSMLDIDLSRIKVYLDETDVSDEVDVDSTYLFVPSHAIMPGIHTVRVNITNILGQKYNDISWSFTVLPGQIETYGTIKKQSGQLRANYIGASVDKSAMDIGEIEYHHKIDFDWLLMDAHYVKSSLENQYDQPYDRYYLNFSNKFFKIKLGDSHPLIDDYAWNGRRIRGVNFSFRGGPLSVDMINGMTKRAIQGNPVQNAMVISAIDSTTDNWGITISRNNYTFQQDVTASKLGLSLGKKIKWDINFIKVQDNIPTVSNEVSSAEIVIPDELMSIITSDDNTHSIIIDSLMNNIPGNITLNLPSTNWVGQKPEDNFIFGSNLEFGFDDSRILIKNGFSLSFLNLNKWNNFQDISVLDTLEYDSISQTDGMFLEYIDLDTSISITQYESYISFGHNEQPMIPFMLKKDNIGFSDILNLSNLNKYSILQLRYFGHRVELGSKRNGPDYYSLLNPSLKINYKETYFSDRFNLFQNKLLIYYKRSKIIEGLYAEISNPIEIRKSLINIALYPGSNLPTFNLCFFQSDRNNGIETYKVVVDTIFYNNLDSIFTEIMDSRIDITSRQFNISMTNQFQLWVSQVLSVNILRYEQVDKVAENISRDSLLAIGYLPKDALSESYGINIKSVYNNHWESSLYFSTSKYDYIDDEISDYQKQELNNYQFRIIYRPNTLLNKLTYAMHSSSGRGTNYYTQYNFYLGITSKPIERLYLNMNIDYRIKYLGNNDKSHDDVFFRAQIMYDIL